MNVLTENEALTALVWPMNYHSGRYLSHPDWPVRAVLNWETSYVGDLNAIALFAVNMFDRAHFVHWLATPGASSCAAFDAVVKKSLFGVADSSWPLVSRFDAAEKQLLVGYIAHRMLG